MVTTANIVHVYNNYMLMMTTTNIVHVYNNYILMVTTANIVYNNYMLMRIYFYGFDFIKII
jgi:hypothetical protein